MPDARAALVSRLAGLLPGGEGPILLVDLPEAAATVGARAAAPGTARVAAALIGGTEDDLIALGRGLRESVEPGGLVALLLPVLQSGWRAAAARAFGRTPAARRPRDLEEICTALLAAGAVPIRVERAKDLALAWGTV